MIAVDVSMGLTLGVFLAGCVILVGLFVWWFIQEMIELGRRPGRRPVRGGAHAWHPPTPREASGPGMPIPLGQLPPLPIGPWPAHLVLPNDGNTGWQDPVDIEIEDEWAWEHAPGQWPLYQQIGRGL